MSSTMRPPGPATNIPYLDGWRGIAILLVLIGHFGPPRFWYAGRLGVVLFFVLSGLFMGRLLFVKRVELPTFFARRFSRIIPTLWFYVAVMWVYASYFQPEIYSASLKEVLVFLGFCSTYALSVWEVKWPVGQLWSLNVEEHSYVYLAAGTLIIARSRGMLSASRFLAGSVIAISICIAFYMTSVWEVGGSPWRTRTEVASLGLVASAAICVWRENGKLAWMRGAWLPLAALLIAVGSFIPGSALQWNFSIAAAPILMAFAVNYVSSFPDIVLRLMGLPILRWFGTCSFSIYLWQAPFYQAHTHFGASKSLCLVLGICCGALSFYLLENPVRLYLNRKWDQFLERREAHLPLGADLKSSNS